MERFEELLHELGIELDVTLHPDKEESCLLVINNTVKVQLECHLKPEQLLLASFVAEIPPGKFRENTLKDALKANYPFPKNGTLAYSDRNNQLALFTFLPLANLNGKKLAKILTDFVEKVNAWEMAIASGTTASLVPTPKNTTGSMFGLTP